MKKIIFFAFVGLFSSCQHKIETPKEKDNSVANVAVVRQMFEAFNAHDWAKMASFYTNPYQSLDPAFGVKYVEKTHDDMLKHYGGLQEWSPNVKDSLVLVEPVGKNKVLVQFVSKGNMAENKMAWELPICGILTLENGKITMDETYYDNEK